MAGSLVGVPLYLTRMLAWQHNFTNILRNLNTTCITSYRDVWRHGNGTNQRRSD